MHRHYKNAGAFLLFCWIFHIVYISERQKKVRNIKLKISKDDLTGFRQLTKEEKRNFYRYIRRQTKPYRIWKLLFTLYVVAIFVMKFITIRESASSTAPPMPDEIIDTLNVASYQMLKLIPVLLIIGIIVNYPHLKKQASEEDNLKIQASSPQALSFPAYPGDTLRHVCKRDPVARQATPVFHR